MIFRNLYLQAVVTLGIAFAAGPVVQTLVGSHPYTDGVFVLICGLLSACLAWPLVWSWQLQYMLAEPSLATTTGLFAFLARWFAFIGGVAYAWPEAGQLLRVSPASPVLVTGALALGLEVGLWATLAFRPGHHRAASTKA